MRRSLRAALTLTAAAVLVTTLSGASLPVAAAAVQPVHKPAWVVPKFHEEPPVLTDAQIIKAAAPERALLAEQAAEAAAAAKAAADAAAQAAAQAAAAARAAAARGHSVNVWTTGFQAQVNACRGGVDMTAHYGMRIVAEHWSCGGSSFPTGAGAVVTFTGLDAGTYRVIGLVATLDAYTAHTYQVPHNYQMLFQTCRGGNSHYTEFIALQRIG
ncbi:MAG: hypothetical protein QOD50_879 [Actinomycetota bacterium]|nr:hypothetical protein [Actinomycetota bacterium]